jgi:hypothetical protein
MSGPLERFRQPVDLAVTYDYRCPFARIAHLLVLDGLEAGGGWDVRFVPFTQSQAHVDHGEAPIWDRPHDDSGLLALQASVVVRDEHPAAFAGVHRGLFALRHEHGRRLEADGIGKVLADHGVPAEDVWERVATGEPLATVRRDHEWAATEAQAWGVPTFVAGDRAAFVRLMERPTDGEAARAAVDRIVDLVAGWPELNELKHTSRQR